MVALLQPITENGLNQGDLVRWMRNVTAALNELITNSGTVRTSIQTLQDDGILGNPTLAIGSTNTRVSNVAFEYMINGNEYNKAAVAAGTVLGTTVIPQATYGCVALDIPANGTIAATEAAANATGYASAALAIAGLPAVAANTVRMGYVTMTKSDGAFTLGTTALDAANTTVAYADSPSIIDNMNAPAAVATAALTLSPS